MTKQEFEKLIKKCINMQTYKIYEDMFNASGLESVESFIQLLNRRNIPEDYKLKSLRIEGKREIPKIEKKIKKLESRISDIDQIVNWLEEESELVKFYRCEKIKIQTKVRKLKASLKRWEYKMQ